MDSDEHLLSAWKRGDSTAGETLFGRHGPSLCRFFQSKIGDDVEDLVQQTFLQCLDTRERDIHHFRAYLFAIARNRLRDRLCSITRRPVDLDTECVAQLGTSLSQRFARNQAEQHMLVAIRNLTVDAQITLELTYWEGLPAPQVAEVLGVSEHTVRSRLARAREHLRAQMGQHFDDA